MRRYSTKEGYDIFPDVKPFFQMLRDHSLTSIVEPWPWNKTVVGIITNSDDRVPGILESFGLEVGAGRVGVPDHRLEEGLKDDISFVVLSYDVGVEKPERRIFDAAVDSFNEILARRDDGLKVDNFEKLYVGDSLEHDFFGAKRAGWNALLLDRSEHYKSVFAKKGKDLVSTTIKHNKHDKFVKVAMVKNLEALRSWYPQGSRDTSPGFGGSEDEGAVSSRPEHEPDAEAKS